MVNSLCMAHVSCWLHNRSIASIKLYNNAVLSTEDTSMFQDVNVVRHMLHPSKLASNMYRVELYLDHCCKKITG